MLECSQSRWNLLTRRRLRTTVPPTILTRLERQAIKARPCVKKNLKRSKGDILAGCSPAFVFWVKKTFNTFNRGYIQACVSFISHVFFITLNSYSIIMIKLDVNRVFCRLATPVMSLCYTKELFPSNCLPTCCLFQSSHLESAGARIMTHKCKLSWEL